MMPGADITIIGAGVIGLAIASELASKRRDVYVIERNDTFGKEQSSRNSEVIHAGIYYEKGSLRARLCIEGNRLLYDLCELNGVPYLRCGKVIVAVNEAEAGEMEKLYLRGRENGASLEMLSSREMERLQPGMKGIAAFFSPTTGIVDSYALCRYFMEKARQGGTQIVYNTEVVGIEKVADGYRVVVRDASGSFSFVTRVLVNCAGLFSDRVAAMAGVNIDTGYRLHWCKGEYYAVGNDRNRLVKRLVYPVPMAISVGVHVCLDTAWRLRLGPLFYYVNDMSYKLDDSRKQAFLGSSIMQALPFIKPDDLTPESAGVMAMLQGPGEGFRDFIIRHEEGIGLPGFINLVGIESPGLTSSPAIAKYVGRMVEEILT